jgi:hypothetical protein
MAIRNDGKRFGLDVSVDGLGMDEGGKGNGFRLSLIIKHG